MRARAPRGSPARPASRSPRSRSGCAHRRRAGRAGEHLGAAPPVGGRRSRGLPCREGGGGRAAAARLRRRRPSRSPPAGGRPARAGFRARSRRAPHPRGAGRAVPERSHGSLQCPPLASSAAGRAPRPRRRACERARPPRRRRERSAIRNSSTRPRARRSAAGCAPDQLRLERVRARPTSPRRAGTTVVHARRRRLGAICRRLPAATSSSRADGPAVTRSRYRRPSCARTSMMIVPLARTVARLRASHRRRPRPRRPRLEHARAPRTARGDDDRARPDGPARAERHGCGASAHRRRSGRVAGRSRAAPAPIGAPGTRAGPRATPRSARRPRPAGRRPSVRCRTASTPPGRRRPASSARSLRSPPPPRAARRRSRAHPGADASPARRPRRPRPRAGSRRGPHVLGAKAVGWQHRPDPAVLRPGPWAARTIVRPASPPVGLWSACLGLTRVAACESSSVPWSRPCRRWTDSGFSLSTSVESSRRDMRSRDRPCGRAGAPRRRGSSCRALRRPPSAMAACDHGPAIAAGCLAGSDSHAGDVGGRPAGPARRGSTSPTSPAGARAVAREFGACPRCSPPSTPGT